MTQRVAILGAGIIGLLSARLLLQRGVQVVLCDVARPARAASWAGGGIVSPLYPWHYTAAVNALAAGAQQAHASLAAALCRETGIDPEYNPCGLLMVSPPEPDLARDWCRRHGRRVVPCDADGLRCVQPGLGDALNDGWWMPEVGSVRNPRLLRALLAYVEQHPAAEVAWRAQVSLRAGEGDAQLRVDDRAVDCDAILVAAGAWSAALLRPFGIVLPVRPVRGQMLQFAPAPGLLRCVVLHAGRYLVPRRDGRILVGSTLEETGFDAAVTTDARDSLHASALSLLPALRHVPVESHWAGLRPGSPAGVPFIDRVPGTRVFVNAGHFRNGLVLAPAAAQLGVDLLTGAAPAIDPAPYALAAQRRGEWV